MTHSQYGVCTSGDNSTCGEVAPNNSGESTYYATYTGRSSGVANSTSNSEEGSYTYDETSGYMSSTTGTIYGVYDMSGGSWEEVMGNSSTSAGSYVYPTTNSGTNYTYGDTTSKYLTTYSYGTTSTDQVAYNRGRLGDATCETILTTAPNSNAWNTDSASYVYGTSNSWFVRGQMYFSNGIFTYSNNVNAAMRMLFTTRATLSIF